MLNTVSLGSGGTPLLIAHGLFGSARNWGVIARRLSDTRRVLAVDMRNHGESFRAPAHRYPDLAADLAEVIEKQGGQIDVLGHSMGGKAAMMLALSRPGLVRRLVVADIAPVAYGHSQSHLIRAMRGLDIAPMTRRSEADGALAQEVETPSVRAFLLQSLDLKVRPPRWRLNLDVLEAEMAHITGWPEGVAGAFTGPALFLSGDLSDYVEPRHRPRIKALFPAARFARIPGAGHWLHAEKPREFEAAVRAFLD
ncbi:pimeloyl-ACP methyl ester carboxylesterase [Rhodovulum imhoffii]|uniref:Pimeloyl-ACP methyl ester carboxylesterase n=1 Tax=Rhodovulum imhoffii TaxID=365340 RepID=A0A2T5BT01_9RHOB|nr:alpha/beta fold hydrolase [Rhodovulum imhoffii]MBK5932674.1 alpha/beta hydrolase [Rhodovulum imhoffii]PTN02510.1 pimeloyl-ACP methyl ester carboxylesterase [Rhodovulum imhoffii]